MRLLQVSLLVQYRFNRYMVECELDRFKLKRYCKLGFNRYMVECE